MVLSEFSGQVGQVEIFGLVKVAAELSNPGDVCVEEEAHVPVLVSIRLDVKELQCRGSVAELLPDDSQGRGPRVLSVVYDRARDAPFPGPPLWLYPPRQEQLSSLPYQDERGDVHHLLRLCAVRLGDESCSLGGAHGPACRFVRYKGESYFAIFDTCCGASAEVNGSPWPGSTVSNLSPEILVTDLIASAMSIVKALLGPISPFFPETTVSPVKTVLVSSSTKTRLPGVCPGGWATPSLPTLSPSFSLMSTSAGTTFTNRPMIRLTTPIAPFARGNFTVCVTYPTSASWAASFAPVASFIFRAPLAWSTWACVRTMVVTSPGLRPMAVSSASIFSPPGWNPQSTSVSLPSGCSTM